ncbi:hypothetical protein DFH06DRAFT_1150805 [Mycena polygramma]|nr:hypothetical protein DFH06DRAFT_1150805 [Mycena polygramma]
MHWKTNPRAAEPTLQEPQAVGLGRRALARQNTPTAPSTVEPKPPKPTLKEPQAMVEPLPCRTRRCADLGYLPCLPMTDNSKRGNTDLDRIRIHSGPPDSQTSRGDGQLPAGRRTEGHTTCVVERVEFQFTKYIICIIATAFRDGEVQCNIKNTWESEEDRRDRKKHRGGRHSSLKKGARRHESQARSSRERKGLVGDDEPPVGRPGTPAG